MSREREREREREGKSGNAKFNDALDEIEECIEDIVSKYGLSDEEFNDIVGFVEKMSFENKRFDRMQKIVELLRANPQGLTIRVIAKETKVLMHVRKETLLGYLHDLEYSKLVIYSSSKDLWKLRK